VQKTVGSSTVVWYGPGLLVLARSHRKSRLLAVLAGFLLVLTVPATGPAQSPAVTALKRQQAALAAQSQAAVVELYGLDSRLEQARGDLQRIDGEAAVLAHRQGVLRLEYRSARRTMTVAQRRLGAQLRYLYEQGQPDPIAVVLGATSLEDAINGLEAVNRTTRATRSVVESARSAQTTVAKAKADLAVQIERTREARARAAATETGLEQARAERASYLVSLRQQEAMTTARIGQVEAQARAAAAKAREVTRQAAGQTPPPAPDVSRSTPATTAAVAPTTSSATADTTTDSAPSTPPPAPVDSVSTTTAAAPAATPAPARPGGTMTVFATGYCLRGTTATGLPVGPGIVATDPSVIPLGTRMTIPGYGEGVAADTGGAIVGNRIDVWIADCGQAAAFSRTVTITFH
jgi:3D (Asp-Asp-Asp) domain-containing protein/peptidoglycan hydrolase CwlO-like protein